MNITFFGTCANDHSHLFECLKTIKNQSLSPNEIIIVDSGDKNIKHEIYELFAETDIKLTYHFQKLSRVKALNKAISLSSCNYLIRFDTRTRFNKDYSSNAFKLLHFEGKKFVGGVAKVIPENSSYKANFCSEIMKRSYIFFYPRHRRKDYVGYGSSVYLGCFDSKLLKETLYNEKKNLISEDSLLASNLKEKGHPPFITKDLDISYVCRSSVKNVLKLFNNYGYCRANSFLLTGQVHSKKRYSLIFLCIIFYFILTFKNIFLSALFLVFIFLIINIFGEIYHDNKRSIIYPFMATVLQFSWFLGLIKGFIYYIFRRNLQTNFLN